MDNISFTSLIRPVTGKEFSQITSAIARKNFAAYPWTAKESVKAEKAFTTRVCDCTLLGLTDGKDVLMMHLCPTQNANKNRFELKRFIAQKMDMKNPDLQTILIGSKENTESQNLYNTLQEILESYNIPFSELKISGKDYSIDTAYSSQKDEWIVTCRKIDKLLQSGVKNNLEVLKNIFKKVNISACDEIA